jgi:SMC interacting uncharacterized protein involved in chromosome segregation
MLKSLIENQTIQIDAHQRGNRENISWDSKTDDIHIHKRTNWKAGGKNIEVEIKVPINSERPVLIRIVTNVRKKDQIQTAVENQLLKEIQKAFADKATREAFIDDLLKILENYKGQFNSLSRAQSAIKRVVKHFGLPAKIENEIESYVKGKLKSINQTYKIENNYYFVNFSRNNLTIGQAIVQRRELRDRRKRS